jgi:DMSO/TMAO reductase YedYZ molybdopterin-dependent catalytic subunit
MNYDIPAIDAGAWGLELTGRVARPAVLSLDALKRRETVTVPVTMECAGNGRARLAPRPVSQPWLTEAVGTAAWTGTALAPLLRDAAPADDTVEVLFTALDRGVEGGARGLCCRRRAPRPLSPFEWPPALVADHGPLRPRVGPRVNRG